MRRLTAIALIGAGASAWLAAGAIGEDSHSYRIELDNAFGIVPGSQVRVAGVNVGTVDEVEVNAEKRAEVTVDVAGELASFGTETECSAEPQSLIAEYFIDCDPAGAPLPDGGLIPVSQTRLTVQPDLVQATLREPYRRRLALLINEFGTGLAGNGEHLNEAIKRGAPALRELDQAISILAERNDTIAAMVGDSDRILSELEAKKEDVSRFVTEAKELAEAGSDRRTDLATDFDRLDDLLAELTPTLAELRAVGRATEPVLSSLQRSAPELERLTEAFPGFARSAAPAVRGLGRAAVTGRRAVSEGAEEIEALRISGKRAGKTSEPLKDFLADIDDPRRIVEYDDRAARRCDDDTRPCWGTGRDGPTGYTGLEGILNYAYYLAGATNQVDTISHILHVAIYSYGSEGDECGLGWWTGRSEDGEITGVPKQGGGLTTDLLEADTCVSWLGPNQPDINQPLNLPPYDPSVCPEGSLAPELCDPGDEGAKRQAKRGKRRRPGDPPAKINATIDRVENGVEKALEDERPGPLGDLLLPDRGPGERPELPAQSPSLERLLDLLIGEPQ